MQLSDNTPFLLFDLIELELLKAGHKPGSVHTSVEGGWLSIWDRRCRRPRAARLFGTVPMASRRSLALLPAGFTEPAPLDAAGALLPHLCTLACASEPAIGGVFLWHCPHGHPHWALPSKLGHQGARTFLSRYSKRSAATTSPTFISHHALWA